MNSVLLSEPIDQVVLVLSRTFGQVAGNPDIKRAVLLARQNVDGRLPFHNQPGFRFHGTDRSGRLALITSRLTS